MNVPGTLPVLIYDGDCDICLEWVQYWEKLTEKKIIYRAYQDVYTEYPDISLNDFKKSIQFVEHDNTIRSGADAAFSIYKKVPGMALLHWLYSRLSVFALFSELSYNFFSQHRELLSFFTHLFWGKDREPARYTLTSQLFLRLLGSIYLAAFLSFGTQIVGLIGSEGVLPLEQYLPLLKQYLGSSVYWRTPMVFWIYLSDTVLQVSCVIGALLSGLLMIGIFQRSALILLYLLYLSLFYAGQTFMTFQWDLLLLEVGFLAIFLPGGSKLLVWLYRWLLFRFMFLGGVVKIISRDPTWDNLTALNYHFETQPLPTIFAWYAHHLPEALLTAGVALTLVIELILPFLIFAPRRFRMTAGFCFIVFQSLIMLTGNYNFFNLLTIAICLFLFDDAAISSILPAWSISRLANQKHRGHSRLFSYAVIPVSFVLLFSSVEQMTSIIDGKREQSQSSISKFISPWHIVHNYGPFAVMTTVRHEIVIEGSIDGVTWQEYHFRYKPGDVSHYPVWATPHQPRLDWQMWFAALSQPEHTPWFRNLLYRLLVNSASVTDLFTLNPFPDSPPTLVRARYYEYHFSNPSEKKSTGDWWDRKLLTDYYPPIQLSSQKSVN